MLDDDERTVLEETEKALVRDDPGLARRMRHAGRGHGPRVAVAVTTLVLVVGLCWLALPGHALLTAMIGVAFLLRLGWRPRDRFLMKPDRERPPTT